MEATQALQCFQKPPRYFEGCSTLKIMFNIYIPELIGNVFLEEVNNQVLLVLHKIKFHFVRASLRLID